MLIDSFKLRAALSALSVDDLVVILDRNRPFDIGRVVRVTKTLVYVKPEQATPDSPVSFSRIDGKRRFRTGPVAGPGTRRHIRPASPEEIANTRAAIETDRKNSELVRAVHIAAQPAEALLIECLEAIQANLMALRSDTWNRAMTIQKFTPEVTAAAWQVMQDCQKSPDQSTDSEATVSLRALLKTICQTLETTSWHRPPIADQEEDA